MSITHKPAVYPSSFAYAAPALNCESLNVSPMPVGDVLGFGGGVNVNSCGPGGVAGCVSAAGARPTPTLVAAETCHHARTAALTATCASTTNGHVRPRRAGFTIRHTNLHP